VVTTANIGNLVFSPAANANGNAYASFTFSVRDQSNAFDTAPNTLTINVTPVNDAPTLNDAPGIIGTSGSLLPVTGMSVADVDNDTLTLTLTVSNGVLSVSPSGATVSTGNGTASLTLSGTAADLNTTINSLFYQSIPGYTGPDALHTSVTDGVFHVSGTTPVVISAAAIDPTPTPTPPVPPTPTPTPPPPAPTPTPTPPSPTPSGHGNGGSGGPDNLPPALVSGPNEDLIPLQTPEVTPPPAQTPQPRSSSNDAGPQPMNSFDFNLAGVDLHNTNATGAERFDSKLSGHSEEGGEETSLEIQVMPTATPDADQDSLFDISPSQAGKMAAAAMSAGMVFWASRSVGLLAALMASVPAWRTVDPLPILARDRRRKGKMDDLLPDEMDPEDRRKGNTLPEARPVFQKSTLMTEVES
jgi:hypothetical protein